MKKIRSNYKISENNNGEYDVIFDNEVVYKARYEYNCESWIDSQISKSKEAKKIKIIVVSVITVIIALAIGLFMLIGLYKLDPGEQAIIVNKLDGSTELVTDIGYGFSMPVVTDVNTTTTAEQVYDREDTANTADAIQTTFKGTITFKVNDVEKFYSKKYNVSYDAMTKVINTELTKALDVVANTYDYEWIKSNVAAFSEEVVAAVNIPLESYGLQVVNYTITSLVVPENIQKALDDKVAKQQAAEAAQYDTQKAEEQAKQQEIQEASGAQSQEALCQQAIKAGQTNNPACYFGEGDYASGTPVVQE